MSKGKLFGIGVGPGDSELLTVKAIHAVRAADMIIAPHTEKKEGSVALNIAAPYIPNRAEILPLVFPMTPDFESLKNNWIENRNIIASYLDQGKNVVFLTLGDPMFYSTYMYIYRAFEGTDYDVETIPGVPAFLSISAALGYPLAEQNDTVVILPATADNEKIDRVLSIADRVVIMKVYKNWEFIQKELRKYGLIENAVLVSRAGLPDEAVYRNLDEISADFRPNYLSTILTRK